MYNEQLTPFSKHLTMLFIFMLNSVTDKMLPCGTPSYWWYESERVLPTRTVKFLPVKHFEINFGILPRSPALKSFRIPYFHVVS